MPTQLEKDRWLTLSTSSLIKSRTHPSLLQHLVDYLHELYPEGNQDLQPFSILMLDILYFLVQVRLIPVEVFNEVSRRLETDKKGRVNLRNSNQTQVLLCISQIIAEGSLLSVGQKLEIARVIDEQLGKEAEKTRQRAELLRLRDSEADFIFLDSDMEQWS